MGFIFSIYSVAPLETDYIVSITLIKLAFFFSIQISPTVLFFQCVLSLSYKYL